MLLHTPACVLPSHLLQWLLFSSHTSLLVPNWWERHGTSVDDSLRINQTDLFLRFFTPRRPGPTQRSCTPGISGELRLPSELDPDGQSAVTLYAQHQVFRLNFVADVSWGRTERFCTPAAISADVSAMSYGGTHIVFFPRLFTFRGPINWCW